MKPERQILHVDDDPQMTLLVAERLSPHGYEVVSLNDPTQAINELVQNQWRVVLLDVDMPRINGLDLLREIKAYDGGVQVIMLTGIVTVTTVLQSFRWGAEACFFKPLNDIEPLVEAIDNSFKKIDHWWGALEDLSHRKHHAGVPAIA